MSDKDQDRPAPDVPEDEDEKTLFRPGPAVSDDEKTLFNRHPLTTEPPLSVARSIAPLSIPVTARTLGDRAAMIPEGTLINNNYIVEAVLKSGGMGSVYLGSEIGTGDPVAIKGVLPELAEDAKAGQMFKLEARTLRQLSHPAIVRYYNYVHDPALDQYFLIMEYIEGEPLSDRIKARGALPLDAVRTLMDRLSAGLAQAHDKGVIHRDLSPDNAMLPEGDVAQARLIDFGISLSKTLGDGTGEREFAGKYKFVAPEQLSGEGIGPAADVYGLALMMTAAAVGKALDIGGGPEAAVAARQSIPDVSAVPESLRPLIAHMLEPDPTMRPASMQEVRRMLHTPSLVPARYGGSASLPETVSADGLQVPKPHPNRAAPPEPAFETTAEPAPKGNNRAIGLLFGAFFVISAAVGFGAWQMDMIGQPESVSVHVTEAAPESPQSRSAFLAGFPGGACTYLTRVRTGKNTGMVEAFSQSGNTFPALSDQFAELFGARPTVLPRVITASQCPALSFMKALQSDGARAPVVVKSGDEIKSGDALDLRVGGVAGQSLWAVLITPKGQIFNLTEHLSEEVGLQRSLEFRLQLADGATRVPQLVLIVASDSPLVRAATAPDGDRAADVLPRILEEIRTGASGTTATLEHVMLVPDVEGDPI